MKTDNERAAILEREIERYSQHGYRLVARTATSAQMVKPKEFSFLVALLGLLFFVVGLLVYLLLYLAESDSCVLIQVDAFGTLRHTGSSDALAVGRDPITPEQYQRAAERIRADLAARLR